MDQGYTSTKSIKQAFFPELDSKIDFAFVKVPQRKNQRLLKINFHDYVITYDASQKTILLQKQTKSGNLRNKQVQNIPENGTAHLADGRHIQILIEPESVVNHLNSSVIKVTNGKGNAYVDVIVRNEDPFVHGAYSKEGKTEFNFASSYNEMDNKPGQKNIRNLDGLGTFRLSNAIAEIKGKGDYEGGTLYHSVEFRNGHSYKKVDFMKGPRTGKKPFIHSSAMIRYHSNGKIGAIILNKEEKGNGIIGKQVTEGRVAYDIQGNLLEINYLVKHNQRALYGNSVLLNNGMIDLISTRSLDVSGQIFLKKDAEKLKRAGILDKTSKKQYATPDQMLEGAKTVVERSIGVFKDIPFIQEYNISSDLEKTTQNQSSAIDPSVPLLAEIKKDGRDTNKTAGPQRPHENQKG